MKTVKLGDLLECFDSARRPIKSVERVDGPTPYLGASGVVDYVAGHTHSGNFLCVSEDGENLRTRNLPIAWVQRGEFWANNHLHVLGGTNVSRLRFIEGALAATDIAGYLTGSTQPKLTKSALLSIEVPAVDCSVQTAIGEVLGALDDKIAANRVVSIRAEELAKALTSKCDQFLRLSEVAQQRRSSVSPMKLGTEIVLHYSLPAFDEGQAALESADEIKSAKNEIKNPAVLISKLNPRIPRLWPVDTSAANARRLASTEFVVLESPEMGVGELWAAILQGDVFGQLQSLTGGTSSSHQRVRPQDVLNAVVPDTRQLEQADRELLVFLCRLRNQLIEANATLARARDELLPLLIKGRITVKDAEHAVEGVL